MSLLMFDSWMLGSVIQSDAFSQPHQAQAFRQIRLWTLKFLEERQSHYTGASGSTTITLKETKTSIFLLLLLKHCSWKEKQISTEVVFRSTQQWSQADKIHVATAVIISSNRNVTIGQKMTKSYLSSVIYCHQCFLSETPVAFDQVDAEKKAKITFR